MGGPNSGVMPGVNRPLKRTWDAMEDVAFKAEMLEAELQQDLAAAINTQREFVTTTFLERQVANCTHVGHVPSA